VIEWLLHLAQALLLAYQCGATYVTITEPEDPMWDVRSVQWSLDVYGLWPCEPRWDYPCALVVYETGEMLAFMPCR
jgi:hypothetical protein